MGKSDTNYTRLKPFLFGAIAFQALILVFTQFTAWPEMTLWPYLVLKGWLPYRDIAIAHNPILVFDLAVFHKLFGIGVFQLKLYTWLYIFLTEYLLFFVVERVINKKYAALSTVAYIFLQYFYLGNGLWFDLALTPFVLLTFYFVYEKKWFWSGVFWSLAFFCKQTAIWFLPAISISWLVFNKWSLSNVIKCKLHFLLGVVCISLPIIFVFYLLGILPNYLYWAYKFGIFTLPKQTGQILLPTVKQFMISLVPFFVSLIAVFSVKEERKKAVVLFAWSVFGIAGAYPRWELFHFQPGIPFIAISFGIILFNYKKLNRKYRILGVVIISAFLLMFLRKVFTDWGKQTRFYDNSVKEVVEYVKYRVPSGGNILVVNSWDNIYALTNTLPSTNPWTPQLQWYLNQPGVGESISKSLNENPPKVIIAWPYQEKGLGSERVGPIDDFISLHYKLVDNVSGYLVYLRINYQ